MCVIGGFMEIKEAVTVITGGGNGLGESIAKEFSKEGAMVVVADVKQSDIRRVVGDIEDVGGVSIGVTVDVTSEEDVKRMYDETEDAFGKINIVVPCAGIIRDALTISTDKETGKVKNKMSLEDFKQVIEVNLVGTFLTIRDAAERMINNNWGGVLFTISSINKEGQVGQINYSSSKTSVALIPKILVGEFHSRGVKNIRCVGIAPGYLGTPMVKGMNQKVLTNIIKNVPIGRLIETGEISSLMKEVVRNEAINGSTIEITGGLISSMVVK